MDSEKKWFYTENGERKGPVEKEKIIELIKAGSVTYGALVWTKGLPDWKKLEDTELKSSLDELGPPPLTPPDRLASAKETLGKLTDKQMLRKMGEAGLNKLLGPEAGDGAPTSDISGPPPVGLLKDHFAWGIVAISIVNVIAYPSVANNLASELILGFFVVVLNVWLARCDAGLIEATGLYATRSKWWFLWAIISPVYLYMRAYRTQRKPVQLYAFLVLWLAVGVVSAPKAYRSYLETQSVKVVDQILEDNFGTSAAKCARVKILEKTSGHTYAGSAYLENGNTLNVAIRTEDGLEVQLF